MNKNISHSDYLRPFNGREFIFSVIRYLVACLTNNLHLLDTSKSHHGVFHEIRKFCINKIGFYLKNCIINVLNPGFIAKFTSHKSAVFHYQPPVLYTVIIHLKKPNLLLNSITSQGQFSSE